ncbi:MAG: hypothetical protein ACI8QQ_000308, partial [Psychroserpens sp.]
GVTEFWERLSLYTIVMGTSAPSLDVKVFLINLYPLGSKPTLVLLTRS